MVAGAEEGRRTLLRRTPLGEETLPDEIWERTREVVGDVATPEEAVRKILRDVREQGDEAVFRYCEAFDGASYSTLRVAPAEIQAAYAEIDDDLLEALRFAAKRIRAFHETQREHVLRSFDNQGIGVKASALARVGINAPGTAVVYPSTVLMTVLPAKAAGVEDVLIASPTDAAGKVSAVKLVAADIAGADGVFRMSGAQAMAAFAYGTESVPRVDKVCGPGNLFVTLAKRAMFGDVGIDALYGPSETIVIADEHADPMLCAADLLGQAEHDELATPILITTSSNLAGRVGEEVERQLKLLDREAVARASFEARGGAVVVESVAEAIALADEFAPEHLCLLVENAQDWAGKVRNAGGVFAGEMSPETLGDYTAGPSHAMPTMGSARFASPLGVNDFLKATSLVAVDEAMLREIGPAAARIARAEGFTGHARTIELRLGERD
ncbi:MAG: histidinol dehydrogenase [Chloroflexi bacterium]|nr:histidinol dehydrogenase [Chloroflexota bacterium]